MGTYTTNYQLYMPTVGETGWGTLVNGNFTTIDTTMKGLDTRITAVENEVNGALNCTSVTTSGEITGNGGIIGTTGTFSGAISALNLPHDCLTPLKLYASTSNAPSGIMYSGGIGYYSFNSVSINNYAIINNIDDISVVGNGSLTVKYVPYVLSSNRIYQFNGDLSITGSWGYAVLLQTNSANTVTITNKAGLNKSFNSANGAYQSIAASEFKSIIANVNTVTIKNNTGTTYGYYKFGVCLCNTNSGTGYVYATNYEYL